MAVECPYLMSARLHFSKISIRPEDSLDIYDADFKDRMPRDSTEMSGLTLRAHTMDVQRHMAELLKDGKSGSGEVAFQGLTSDPGTALLVKLTSQPLTTDHVLTNVSVHLTFLYFRGMEPCMEV